MADTLANLKKSHEESLEPPRKKQKRSLTLSPVSDGSPILLSQDSSPIQEFQPTPLQELVKQLSRYADTTSTNQDHQFAENLLDRLSQFQDVIFTLSNQIDHAREEVLKYLKKTFLKK